MTVASAGSMTPKDAGHHLTVLIDEIERAVIGKRAVLELIVAGFVSGGHVLLDDVPGVAKTLIARSFAEVSGLHFSRVQFTPDVLPADITGTTVLDVASATPRFRQGPLFAQVVLADEINRAPAKTQSALLEAMQESQVTADGTSHRLPAPFFVLATQNPVESEGTYSLPEAQLDRFVLRTSVGYPARTDEVGVVERRLGRASDRVELSQRTDPEHLAAVRAAVESVHVERVIVDYAVDVVRATRESRELALGASPRGSLALIGVARGVALLAGRDFVTADDVRSLVVPCLAHRVIASDESWARGVSTTEIVQRAAKTVDAPSS